MSVESLAIVLHHSKAAGTDKLVLVGIANHDGDGGAWPAVATLARYANVEPRAVQKSLARLIAAGELSREIQGGGTRGMTDHSRPNRYQILVKCPPNCDRTAQHRTDTPKQTPPLSARTPPVLQDTPPPVLADTPPLSARTPEPSFNHPLNSEKSPFVSTSPEIGELCFACGKPGKLRGRFCVPCRSSGRDNPMLNCWKHADGCTVVGKRQFAGQQFIKCSDHR